MVNFVWKTSVIFLILISLSGCNEDFWLNYQLSKEIAKHNLTGDPAEGRTLPHISEPLPQLGKALFFSKALGGDKDTACVSCHYPTLGGADGLALPIGVGAEEPDVLGPGRRHSSSSEHYDGGPTVPRNSPTVFNMGLWDRSIFHDGRIESLFPVPGQNGAIGGIATPDVSLGMADPDAGINLTVAQTRFPVTSKEEMRGFEFESDGTNADVRNHLANRLQGASGFEHELDENRWLDEFRDVFNQTDADAESLITYGNIALALGEYERSMVFTNTPWKQYVQGDMAALSKNAKKGALLFFNEPQQGGAGCVNCHSGDNFTDEDFHVIAMPQIGRGKEDSTMDQGRWYVTGADNDRYAFRTPSLLNVTKTSPWGHAGAYSSLKQVILHHANPQQAITQFDYSELDQDIQASMLLTNTRPALKQLQTLRSEGQSKLPRISLSDKEVLLLIAFVESLTDPCVEDRECLSPWIATGNGPDGLTLHAINKNGDPL